MMADTIIIFGVKALALGVLALWVWALATGRKR